MLLVQHSSCQFPLCCVAMFGKTGCRQKAFSSLEPLSLSLFIILHLAALFPFFSLFFYNKLWTAPSSVSAVHKVLDILTHTYTKELMWIFGFCWLDVHPYKKGKVSNPNCHIMILYLYYDLLSMFQIFY